MQQSKMLGFDVRIVQGAALFAAGFAVWAWLPLVWGQGIEDAIYFLKVGQGDSQLISLDRGRAVPPLTILIDGGRDRRVIDALADSMPGRMPRRIDLVILTHPDTDHFGGLIDIVRRFEVGLFVSNGQTSEQETFAELEKALRERSVPTLALAQGDRIRFGAAHLSILSPDDALRASKTKNEASIVALFEKGESRVLLTGDIGFAAEEALLKKNPDLRTDVLKVAHHGSKNSTGEQFAAAVQPALSVIGVGQNRYGHPDPRVLETLDLAGSRIHRTDTDGTLKILLDK